MRKRERERGKEKEREREREREGGPFVRSRHDYHHHDIRLKRFLLELIEWQQKWDLSPAKHLTVARLTSLKSKLV